MIIFAIIESGGLDANQLIDKWGTIEDRTEAEQRQNDNRKHDYLLTRSGARALLHQITDISNWHIRSDSDGKPYSISTAGELGPHISLSHTKGLVACAISSDSPVGIDVEYWRVRRFRALSNYAFGPLECEEVTRDGMSAFYRIWTMKEAWAKASGNSLLSILNKKDTFSNVQENDFLQTDKWQFHYLLPQSNYSLAIATKDQHTEPHLSWAKQIQL